MPEQKYYAAYDDRYRQIHAQDLQWFQSAPSPIVAETIREFSISTLYKVLEIGCGEGRDAYPLLDQGFDLLATDVSPEAIAYCRKNMPDKADHFQILDCIGGELAQTFDFIFAIAVVHMLVPDDDRAAFYRFVRSHLNPNGIALIGTMGDGITERRTDIRTAFQLQTRTHQQSGKEVQIAATSCRMVSFPTFEHELRQSGLTIVKQGNTSIEPDFPQMMFAVVKAADPESSVPRTYNL